MSDDRRNFRLTKDALPSRYELHFELDFDTWSSVGSERIAVQLARPAREIVLHSLDLDIRSARIDGDQGEIGQKVADDGGEGRDQQPDQGEVVVVLEDGVVDRLAHAGPGEHGLGDQRA